MPPTLINFTGIDLTQTMKLKLLIIIICVSFVACKKDYYHSPPGDFEPPTIKLNVTPQFADSTTWFVLTGAGSHDADGMWGIIDFRWDLNNDGIWDTPYTNHPEWVHVFRDTGVHIVKLQVADRFGQTSIDSVQLETYGSITDTSHFVDPRDGRFYKTVRISGLSWMAENLNYGKLIPVTDTVKNDEEVEKYCFLDDPALKGNQGGFYTYYDWMEMMNHDTSSVNGICPPGWEVPTSDDWRLITEAYRRPLRYFAQGGFSNLNLSRMGIHPRWQEWDPEDFSQSTEDWIYFTRDFYKGYLNGPNRIIPYIATSQTIENRGNIYTIQYANDSMRKYMGIAPVRCIKRD